MLAAKALEAGLERFGDARDFELRLKFAAGHGLAGPEGAPVPRVEDALRAVAGGLKSFAELEAAAGDGGLEREMKRQLAPAVRKLLDEIAPESIRLAGGRQVKVHYQAGQPPWIASRLQDFFGMRQTPGWRAGRFRWWCGCWRPINGRCRPLPTWRDSGSGCTRRSARSWRGVTPSMPGRKT